MSRIELIHGSCADQTVDVVVNAANDGLWAGGGICGVIFRKAGMYCNVYKTQKTEVKFYDSVDDSLLKFADNAKRFRSDKDMKIYDH